MRSEDECVWVGPPAGASLSHQEKEILRREVGMCGAG